MDEEEKRTNDDHQRKKKILSDECTLAEESKAVCSDRRGIRDLTRKNTS